MSGLRRVVEIPHGRARENGFRISESSEAGVDTLATIFHPCHRETCHLGEGQPFEIVNLMELVGESLGIHVPDLFKKLKIMGDVDRIIAECADMIAEHDMDVAALREHLEAEIIHTSPFAGTFSQR